MQRATMRFDTVISYGERPSRHVVSLAMAGDLIAARSGASGGTWPAVAAIRQSPIEADGLTWMSGAVLALPVKASLIAPDCPHQRFPDAFRRAGYSMARRPGGGGYPLP